MGLGLCTLRSIAWACSQVYGLGLFSGPYPGSILRSIPLGLFSAWVYSILSLWSGLDHRPKADCPIIIYFCEDFSLDLRSCLLPGPIFMYPDYCALGLLTKPVIRTSSRPDMRPSALPTVRLLSSLSRPYAGFFKYGPATRPTSRSF
jgi:hypothetical protein